MSIVKYERLNKPEEVKAWAQEHDAVPAERPLPDGETELTFNVAGKKDGKPLDWDDFLQRFRLAGFSLLVEPDESSSHYFKMVDNESKNKPIEMGMSRGADLPKKAQNTDFRVK